MQEMTLREKLHTILCIGGGISKTAVGMLDGTANYKRKVLYELKQRGLVERRKGIWRMTKAGLEKDSRWHDNVPKIYVELAEKSRSVCMRASEGELRRYMYQSEVLAAMIETGVNLWENNCIPPTGEITYVRAVRMKENYPGDKKAINMSRAQGTLFGAEGNLINVYAMGGGTLTWSHNCEARYKAWTEKRYMEIEGKTREADTVLFIENLGNLKRFIGKQMIKGGPIRAGAIYKRMFVLPKDGMGTSLLALLLLPNSDKAAEKLARELDGFNFILPDVVALRKYLMSGEKNVCCIKEYSEGIRGIAPDAIVTEITVEDLIKTVMELSDT